MLHIKLVNRLSQSFLSVVLKLLEALCLLLGPRFAARICASSIKVIPGRSEISFLVIARPSFDKDIDALVKHTDLGFVIIQKGYTRFQKIFLAPDRCSQTYYQKSQSPFSNGGDPQAEFADELLRRANKHRDISGVLSANIDYWQDVGLKYQCKRRGLMFGVICRENAVIPEIVSANYKRYKESAYKFDGDFVVMAGEKSAEMFRSAGAVDASSIYATGLPRYDVWHNAASQPQPDLITLLTFTHGYGADQTFKEVLTIFLQLATCNSGNNVTFLIKTKDTEDTRMVQSMLPKALPANLLVNDKISMVEALSRSRGVVGYNSLSIIDALLSGCKILIPGWGDCEIKGNMCMYPKCKKSERFISYQETETALIASLNSLVKSNPGRRQLDGNCIEYIQKYVTYRPDCLSSNSFEKMVLQLVQKKYY